jgi:hypothetical protein
MKRFAPLNALFLIAVCAISAPAVAQKGPATWRCGSSYSDQPCAGGKAVNAQDARSTEDRRAADAATQRIERRADQLERQRLDRERTTWERDRQVRRDQAAESRAERRLASQLRLDDARRDRLAHEPGRSTQKLGGKHRKSAG